MAEMPERTDTVASEDFGVGERTIDDSGVRPSRPLHKDPKHIGPYRIFERIGEGGMGIVYKAEEREPVRRIVALKVIKLGMDTKEVVARFEAERQALAMLSHPNVARVFEAGMTENGRPFFTMEFVPGVSITHYCDENKLNTRQRLELFIPVCLAIQHAHQKGIIHRDLKPGNILVTLIDGKPVPKVIDFGIAKATNQALTQHTLFTQTGALIGTPEYMSPEQAMTSGLDVDTRTDIYSLGAILYELLTGTLPLDAKVLRTAGMEGMARLIKTSEPQKPSTRLLTRVDGAMSDAAVRPTRNTRLLQKELRGDLDWIVLKAIEKDRGRRYETANGLAMDIQRHLDNEPVLARPPSTRYRMQKFVSKHRVGVGAATVIALLLVLGVATSTILYLKSVAAEKRIASALAELRSTAPTYISQGRTLFAEQKTSEALAAIEFALRLDPDNPDYNLVQGYKLQALGHLPEAARCFGKVLALRPNDPSAKSNLELCTQLEKTRLPSGQLPSSSNIALVSAMTAEQRIDDLWPLQRIVGREAEANRALIETRTKSLHSLPGWNNSRIGANDDGTFEVNLSFMSVPDLAWVAGLPISEIEFHSTAVADLTPLAGLPLRDVGMNWTKVRDIEPLRGKRLTRLSLIASEVSDLSPLVGMPLEYLDIGSSQVEKLAPLAGLPLKELRLCGCQKIRDFAPISQCAQLQRLGLPAGFQDIGLLRRLPNLRKVALNDANNEIQWETIPAIDKYLPLLERRLAQDAAKLKELHAALAGLGMPEDKIEAVRFAADGLLTLDLSPCDVADLTCLRGQRVGVLLIRGSKNRISDLSPLAGAPLIQFEIKGGEFTDLMPLKDCPLNGLDINSNPMLTDISPLKGKKMFGLSLGSTGVRDLGPIATCTNIGHLYLNNTPVSDLSPVAGCTRLQEFTAQFCPFTDLSPLAKLAGLESVDIEHSQAEDLRPLANLKLRILKIGNTRITDFSPLKHMTALEDFSATELPIKDLSVLSECKRLRMLYLGKIPSTDVRPICGLPLNTLYINDSSIADVSPLLNCQTLEHLLIPRDAKGIEALRKHPRLKRLSYTWDDKQYRVSQSVQEFWAEFDKKPAP